MSDQDPFGHDSDLDETFRRLMAEGGIREEDFSLGEELPGIEQEPHILGADELATIALRAENLIDPDEFDGYLGNYATDLLRQTDLTDFNSALEVAKRNVRTSMQAIGPSLLEGNIEIEPYGMIDEAPTTTNRDPQIAAMIEQRIQRYGLEGDDPIDSWLIGLAQLATDGRITLSPKNFAAAFNKIVDRYAEATGMDKDIAWSFCKSRYEIAMNTVAKLRREQGEN